MSRYDGWDDAAEDRERLRVLEAAERQRKLAKEFPEEPNGVMAVFTVAEADAAHLAVSRYATMLAGHYARGEISEKAYGALLSAREALYAVTLGAKHRSAVDSPRGGA